MPTHDTFTWEKVVLGERYVYPGHPVVLATMIIDRYPDLESASGTGRTYPRATEDSFIPGAGCAVRAGLDFIQHVRDHGVEIALREAERYWANWERQSPRNLERAAHGRRQADSVLPLFLQKLAAWGNEPIPPRFRLSFPAVTEHG